MRTCVLCEKTVGDNDEFTEIVLSQDAMEAILVDFPDWDFDTANDQVMCAACDQLSDLERKALAWKSLQRNAARLLARIAN